MDVVIGPEVVAVVLLIVKQQFSGKYWLHLCCDHLPGALWIWKLVSKTQHYLVSGQMSAIMDILLKLN